MRMEVQKAIRIAREAIRGFGGGPATDEMLDCIEEYVGPGMLTIETGCGLTTGAFIGAGAKHWFVDIDTKKAQAVEIALHGAPRLVWLGGDSAQALPRYWYSYSRSNRDFALMDGCDTNLTTVIDAIYLFKMLNPGGYLLIDDVQQPWVALAIKVLQQAGIQFVKDVGGRSKLFRKAD